MDSTLVVVSGAPSSGKTTIGKQLATGLGFPFLGKDSLKETLFDTLGSKDRDWSRQLGKASIELLYLFAAAELSAGRSCIVESNFKREWDRNRLLDMRNTNGARILNVHCHAQSEVLFDRFRKRANGTDRHPGHCDASNLAEFREALSQPWPPLLDSSEGLVEIDTTDFGRLSIGAILDEVRKRITEQSNGGAAERLRAPHS